MKIEEMKLEDCMYVLENCKQLNDIFDAVSRFPKHTGYWEAKVVSREANEGKATVTVWHTFLDNGEDDFVTDCFDYEVEDNSCVECLKNVQNVISHKNAIIAELIDMVLDGDSLSDSYLYELLTKSAGMTNNDLKECGYEWLVEENELPFDDEE